MNTSTTYMYKVFSEYKLCIFFISSEISFYQYSIENHLVSYQSSKSKPIIDNDVSVFEATKLRIAWKKSTGKKSIQFSFPQLP